MSMKMCGAVQFSAARCNSTGAIQFKCRSIDPANFIFGGNLLFAFLVGHHRHRSSLSRLVLPKGRAKRMDQTDKKVGKVGSSAWCGS